MSYERTGMGNQPPPPSDFTGRPLTAITCPAGTTRHTFPSSQGTAAWLTANPDCIPKFTATYQGTNLVCCHSRAAFAPAETSEDWVPGEDEGGAPGDDSIEEPASSFLFVGIGLAAILGIGGLSYFLMKKKGKKRAAA